jgi:hypothetical protein
VSLLRRETLLLWAHDVGSPTSGGLSHVLTAQAYRVPSGAISGLCLSVTNIAATLVASFHMLLLLLVRYHDSRSFN